MVVRYRGTNEAKVRRIVVRICFLLVCAVSFASAPLVAQRSIALRPPMGWNDWAHYRCGFTAQTIQDNAKALASTGLSSLGYNTVTIDDCWMQKERDADGNLQADSARFPQGIKPVADEVHALGLKFGIYEDAGFKTCAGNAGSGEPDGGGDDHFVQDARLFASWGVDYLKLDGCNMYVPKGASSAEMYRKAYSAESAALQDTHRTIIFSESAPAYFLDTPDWYDVLTWTPRYGDLWREGWDITTFKPERADESRFHSVLWNYAYNLPLGRFQKPGAWNDPDFLIVGDRGMTIPESRTQMALWAMMSAPLILSSDVGKLSPEAIAILSNKRLISVDQDELGKMATLLRRAPAMDLLFKTLSGGDFAVAILNRGESPLPIHLVPSDLGFPGGSACRMTAENLWTGDRDPATAELHSIVAAHDTEIWRVHPKRSCGAPARIGAITSIVNLSKHDIDSYSRCLSGSEVGPCTGTQSENWTITSEGLLKSGGQCLTAVGAQPALQACAGSAIQRWRYTLAGNLINVADGLCLSGAGSANKPMGLQMEVCGHNEPEQIWSLPN